MNLTSENVKSVLMYVLFKKDEDATNAVIAEGCMGRMGFHPGRLEEKSSDISAMLDELPSDFHQSGGGGHTFLNACMNKDGDQWTGMHQAVDELLMLGLAIGRVRYVMPRELWSMFPGGMPYFVIMSRETLKKVTR